MKFQKKPIKMNVNEIHGKISHAVHQLFEIKNDQYGNAFMKYGRIGLFIDTLRKYERYKNCFDIDDDSIFLDHESKDNIIPSLTDLANYAIMGIVVEIKRMIEGKSEEEAQKIVDNIISHIISGSDKIAIEDEEEF